MAEPRRLISVPRRAPVVRLLLMAAALTTAAMMGGTAARYLKDWSDEALVTAGNFYFTMNSPLYRLTAADGWVSFPVTLQNYVVEGYSTPSEISYTCTVKDGETTVAQARWQDRTAGTETFSGTLAGENDAETLTCFLPAAAFGEKGDKELTVTAVSTAPYAKTLTAKVVLDEGDGGVKLVVTDRGGTFGAVSVTLYNTGGEKCKVTLRPKNNEDLALVTDPTWKTAAAEDGALTIPAGGAVSVVYLKKNTGDRFSESDFTYTVSKVSN